MEVDVALPYAALPRSVSAPRLGPLACGLAGKPGPVLRLLGRSKPPLPACLLPVPVPPPRRQSMLGCGSSDGSVDGDAEPMDIAPALGPPTEEAAAAATATASAGSCAMLAALPASQPSATAAVTEVAAAADCDAMTDVELPGLTADQAPAASTSGLACAACAAGRGGDGSRGSGSYCAPPPLPSVAVAGAAEAHVAVAGVADLLGLSSVPAAPAAALPRRPPLGPSAPQALVPPPRAHLSPPRPLRVSLSAWHSPAGPLLHQRPSGTSPPRLQRSPCHWRAGAVSGEGSLGTITASALTSSSPLQQHSAHHSPHQRRYLLTPPPYHAGSSGGGSDCEWEWDSDCDVGRAAVGRAVRLRRTASWAAGAGACGVSAGRHSTPSPPRGAAPAPYAAGADHRSPLSDRLQAMVAESLAMALSLGGGGGGSGYGSEPSGGTQKPAVLAAIAAAAALAARELGAEPAAAAGGRGREREPRQRSVGLTRKRLLLQ